MSRISSRTLVDDAAAAAAVEDVGLGSCELAGGMAWEDVAIFLFFFLFLLYFAFAFAFAPLPELGGELS
jgi:hypothetical protein